MSENIKASEVSDVLKMQLENISSRVQFDEVGTVLSVGDGVVRIYGLKNAEANELLEFDNGIMAVVMRSEVFKIQGTNLLILKGRKVKELFSKLVTRIKG